MPISPFITKASIAQIKAPVHFDFSQYLKHVGSTAEGAYNNGSMERITDHSSDSLNFNDVVYGNGGYDYISTGGGADKVVVGNNNGTWRGTGNEFNSNATIVDTGSGNDDITVSAKTGAFSLIIGEGQDDVVVKGGDYVKINASDGDYERDTFHFTADFHGRAELSGVDRTDFIDLDGGHWHETQMHGNLAFTNDLGGSVELLGVSASYDPGQPQWDL